jgi:arthrofactin-type cyclic lipopeptide synthetase C
MLGPFMNTVPVRIEGADRPMRELLPRARDATLAALARQDAPWHEVLAILRHDHGADADLLGDVALVVEGPPAQDVQFGDLRLSRAAAAGAVARRALTLSVALGEGEISASLTYATALFTRATVERLVEQFIGALSRAESGTPGKVGGREFVSA